MSTQTSIEWTEQTWNPAVGYSKVSPGCANCYAEAMAKRLLPNRLEEPLKRLSRMEIIQPS